MSVPVSKLIHALVFGKRKFQVNVCICPANNIHDKDCVHDLVLTAIRACLRSKSTLNKDCNVMVSLSMSDQKGSYITSTISIPDTSED